MSDKKTTTEQLDLAAQAISLANKLTEVTEENKYLRGKMILSHQRAEELSALLAHSQACNQELHEKLDEAGKRIRIVELEAYHV